LRKKLMLGCGKFLSGIIAIYNEYLLDMRKCCNRSIFF